MAQVVLNDVKKIYQSHHKKERVVAVKNLNMQIADGEFLALLGPSGCGKTTVLRMIVGLEKATEGRIMIGDKMVNHISPAQRNVSMAFETYALYPHLSVGDNLGLCLKAKKVSKDEIKKQVELIAKTLRITDILNAKSSHLSGGQQQRVSLGRALIRQSSVTLLDEPLSHLDASLRLESRTEIKRIHQQLKRTFILVTHDQSEALALADRIAVMNFAELQQIGTPKELLTNPINLFVADFVGEPPINLFKNSALKKEGDDWFALTANAEYKFKLPSQAQPLLNKKRYDPVIIGIRPQHIGLTNEKGKESFTGKISLFEFLGKSGHLDVSCQSLDINLVVPPDLEVKPGDPIRIYYDPEKILLFDEKTEKNIFYESDCHAK